MAKDKRKRERQAAPWVDATVASKAPGHLFKYPVRQVS